MSDDTGLADRLARQARAETLLNDPLLNEAFDRLTGEYTARWRTSPFADAAGREQLYRASIVVEQVRKHLKLMAADGRLAARELEALEGRRTLMQRMGVV